MKSRRAAAAGLLCAMVAFAAHGTGTQERFEEKTPPLKFQYQSEALLAGMMRASRLTRYEIRDTAGKPLGQVRDLLVDLECSCLTYVVTRFQELERRSGGLYPVPFVRVRANHVARTLSLDLQEQSILDYAPTLEDFQRSGRLDEPIRDVEIQSFWRRVLAGSGTPLTAVPQRIKRTGGGYSAYYYSYGAGSRVFPGALTLYSDLVGHAVLAEGGSQIGAIDGLIVNAANGTLGYLIVKIPESKLHPVPLAMFELHFQEDALMLTASSARLAASPWYSSSSDADFTDAEWNSEIRGYWSALDSIVEARPGVQTTVERALELEQLLIVAVVNSWNHTLGGIDNLVVTENGRAPYVLVDLVPMVGSGGGLHPVPLSALDLDLYLRTAYFDMQPEYMEDLPAVEPDDFPKTQPNWDSGIRRFWNQHLREAAGILAEEEYRRRIGSEQVTAPAVLATELSGYPIQRSDGRRIGSVETLLFDPEAAVLTFAVLSFEPLGIEQHRYAVPVERLEIDPASRRVVLDASAADLARAPTYDRYAGLDTTDPNWAQRLREFWAN